MIKGFLSSVLLVMFFSVAGFAQAPWLDQNPIKNWNTGSVSVPPAPKYDAEEVERCGHTLRPATLAADKVVEGRGWKIINEAHVWGDYSIISVTKGFDGMCRPYDYQVMVFSKDKLIGTLSPDFMVSRTDGALSNVDLWNSGSIRAEYSRYKDSDALCCPSRVEAVFFSINEEGDTPVLVPGDSYTVSGEEETKTEANASLAGTKWKWERIDTPVSTTTVNDPAKYTLEFTDSTNARVLADCNKGTGTFKAEGSSLEFGPFAVTKMACPEGSLDNTYLTDLGYVRIFRVEDGKLYLDLFADGGTMVFSKVE